MDFLCTKECLLILYCLKRLTIYCLTMYAFYMVIMMFHNVLITSYLSNITSKVKSSEIKESVSVSCLFVRLLLLLLLLLLLVYLFCLLDAQNVLLLFKKFTCNW